MTRQIREFVSTNGSGPKTLGSAGQRVAPVFIGHTRFSVHQYGHGSFQASRLGDGGVGFSEEQYTSWLYSAERLEPRADIFLNESIPQLAMASKKHRVAHIVSYSPSLPEVYKERLRDVANRYPFIRLNETTQPANATPPRGLVRAALDHFGVTTGPFGVYRLDDDDILSSDYFDRMAGYIISDHAGWWVSLGRGYSAVRVNGEYLFARELYYPKIALGLLVVAFIGDDGEIEYLHAPKHTVVDQYAPTILDSRGPAIFHIRHKTQDSTVGGTERPFFQEAFLRIRGEGPANLDELARVFPRIAEKVHRRPGMETTAESLLPKSTTLPREGLSYEWKKTGPLCLLVDVPTAQRLRPRSIAVDFTVETITRGTLTLSKEHIEFFSMAKANYSSDEDKFSMYLPHMPTGIGQVLCIEPPEDLCVTSFTLRPARPEEVELTAIHAYPMSATAGNIDSADPCMEN